MSCLTISVCVFPSKLCSKVKALPYCAPRNSIRQGLQDAVKVELLKVECDDSGDLVLSPPFPHLFGMIVGEIVEKFLYRAGRCCDCSEFLGVSFPIYVASECLVSDYVHADPFVSGYFAELLVDILVYAECSCCALVRRSDCSSRPGLF